MNLVPIETGQTSPSKRAEHLRDVWEQAMRAVDVALHAEGLLPNPYLSPGAAHLDGVHALRCREWGAVLDLVSYFERRIQQLERTVRNVLASDALSEDERRALHSAYGRKRHDVTRALSEHEGQLLNDYRNIDAAGKQMLRTLCARLATSNEPGGGAA
jgi:hypothetical protein